MAIVTVNDSSVMVRFATDNEGSGHVGGQWPRESVGLILATPPRRNFQHTVCSFVYVIISSRVATIGYGLTAIVQWESVLGVLSILCDPIGYGIEPNRIERGSIMGDRRRTGLC